GVGETAIIEATDLVRRAFAGEPLPIEAVVERLRELATLEDGRAVRERILCGVAGTGRIGDVTRELARSGLPERGLVALTPAEILDGGLPYRRSETAIILDADPGDVPSRYREPDAAARLVSVVGDAVDRDGL